jgi:hypothetical protein
MLGTTKTVATPQVICLSASKVRNKYSTIVGKPDGTDHLGDLDVDEKILLKYIWNV